MLSWLYSGEFFGKISKHLMGGIKPTISDIIDPFYKLFRLLVVENSLPFVLVFFGMLNPMVMS